MDGKDFNQASMYIIQAQEEEMKRISGELHEGIGQSLYSLNTGLKFIEAGIEQTEVKVYIQEMSQLIERTIREVRLLSVELYPPSLTTLGLLPALLNYSKLFASTFGITVQIESNGEEFPLEEQKRAAVFRVCQEALLNSAKYADVSEIKMAASWEPDRLNMDISDSGKGFDLDKVLASKASAGLWAMMERMVLAGGTCSFFSEAGKGTKVTLTLLK